MSKSRLNRVNELSDIWALRFRPLTLEDLIVPMRIKNQISKFLNQKSIPHLMFISSNPGTGKTSLAKIIINELDADSLFINGSQENGIDVLRTKISTFAKNASLFGKHKIVFIDEADGLTRNAQEALRMFLEEYAKSVRFIITGNYSANFIEPLCSRFREISFELQQNEKDEMMKLFAKRVKSKLDEENIKYSMDTIAKVIFSYFPDYRTIWQTFQEIYDANGEITEMIITSRDSLKRLVDAINSKKLNNVRDVVMTTPDLNFLTVYSYLFKMIDDFNFSIENVAMNLAIYQEKATHVPDKMLNFVGCIADVYLSEDE